MWMESVIIVANMDTTQEGECKDQKGKGNQAGSLDAVGQTQEPEAETGTLELGAFGASLSRIVQFFEPMEQ